MKIVDGVLQKVEIYKNIHLEDSNYKFINLDYDKDINAFIIWNEKSLYIVK